MELTTRFLQNVNPLVLFVMSKIQILNGTHNDFNVSEDTFTVVCDVKDTNFEWNSQLLFERQVPTASCL